MGCFLQCFGLSNKRKRRKTLYNVLAGRHQKYGGSYEVLATTEKSIVPYSGVRDRDKRKEQNVVKSKKKKVTFNLNVQIFEPDPTAYQVLDKEEEEEENKITTAKPEGKSTASTILGEESEDLGMRYPSNYRYYNCRDQYDDEEDEIVYEESDIDDSDDDEFDDAWSEQSLEIDEAEVCDKNSEQKELAPNDDESKSNSSGRDRSINMNSVLIPVENLTQWKAIKAKVASSKHMRKENVPLEQKTSMPFVSQASLNLSPCILGSNALQSKSLLPEIAVDASLSNWLIAPNYNVSAASIHCQ